MSSLGTLSDIELAIRLKSDDEPAFSEIYSRYWDKLYIMARKRLNDKREAEEVVQDIFSNLWRRRDRLELQKGFSHYFAAAVKFEVINRLARRARTGVVASADATGYSDIPDMATLHTLDFNELYARFQEAVNELPEKCRIVFHLKLEHGLSQKEISRQMDISEKTVEAHLAKARKKLRDDLGNISSFFL
ncbi:RNA polymerase sigma-70 factor (ECF subfamily) [Filimonas zeae]|uniref:DNA-directed RNA polymerase sigma-70 factor n=1 Tax=Filimonas zeae TaxID=1737353 RepID=A0A917IVM4_9BACT|nr:RNA polymerase sigma-70 factor [Filimonas zeae]MDR6339232.1 RNA polymerase sigma-70 factor (ECF subfamily) [Filimonas zeae]GGH64506.1 DNA-directed RNA polymerase sigma-70 factor [Filimonas zeae]